MARSIMILGTSSGAGKSTIAAGLCRIFSQDGWDTVPFKAQNLSGNGHILADGGQMARSQAIAACACHKEPTSDMNPLFVRYSQGEVICYLEGQPLKGLDRDGYAAMKQTLPGRIMAAYERVARGRDIVVLEGAGSPVEMNLKAEDLSTPAWRCGPKPRSFWWLISTAAGPSQLSTAR